jgi:hypothetical protein
VRPRRRWDVNILFDLDGDDHDVHGVRLRLGNAATNMNIVHLPGDI